MPMSNWGIEKCIEFFYHIKDKFFWPQMYQDIKYHVCTCHQCQLWSVHEVEIPPTICTPTAIFTKIYVDVIVMPAAGGYKFIVVARDDLTHIAEGHA